jgi:predicted transcriptional regulator
MTDTNGFPELVRELMTVGVFTCTAETPIVDLVPYFIDKNLEEAMVMEDGNAIGVIGQDELVRAIENPEWRSLKVEDLMREDYLRIPADISLKSAVNIMQEKKVRAAYLMHNAAGNIYPAGILTYRHILHLLAAKTPEDLSDKGFSASRQSPLEAFIQKRDAARLKARSGTK